ncbi:unnamed protein product [Leptosia nina]|uniref:Uncharacterized protein n=1 Tax=Leptosia nina TaxID=320188 RepID=A0AAV1K2S2_9NEOP
MAYDLREKIVFITGGALGIGALSAKFFLDEGVKHVTVTDVNDSAGKKLESELNSKFKGRMKFIKCDVTVDEELFGVYNQIINEFGFIDVVINNAGIMNDSIYKKAIEVNFLPSNYEGTGVRVITMCYGATDTSLLSKDKLASFEREINEDLYNFVHSVPLQRADSAAKSLIEVCKQGESGSTWLSKNDLPVEDVTPLDFVYSIFPVHNLFCT